MLPYNKKEKLEHFFLKRKTLEKITNRSLHKRNKGKRATQKKARKRRDYRQGRSMAHTTGTPLVVFAEGRRNYFLGPVEGRHISH